MQILEQSHSLLSEDIILGVISTIMVLVLISGSLIYHLKAEPLTMLKNFLIWLLIFTVLILAYSFRNDFSSFKSRVYGELFPSSPQLVNNEIRIRKSNNGHYKINTTINKQTVVFLVDTGASDVVLPANLAKRIGIDVNNINYTRAYNTANGQIFGAPFKIGMMEIEGIRFYNIRGSVTNSDLSTPLLGMSFLEQLKEYRFKDDVLTLIP